MFGLPPLVRSFVSLPRIGQSMPVAAIIYPLRRTHQPGLPVVTILHSPFRLLSCSHRSSGHILKRHAMVDSVIAGPWRRFRTRSRS